MAATAATGIGGASPKEIDMSVNKVDAATGTGGIYLGNDKALTIDNIKAGSGNIVVKLIKGNILLIL